MVWTAVLLAAASLFVAVPVPARGQGTGLTSVQAQQCGFVVQRPNATTFSSRHGLAIEVDSRWVNNYGYRPVRIRVTSAKPATRDHSIAVRFYVGSWNRRAGSVAVEQDFELLTGQQSVVVTLSCPQYQTGNRYWWDVWVDGKKDESLSVDADAAWQLTAATAVTSGDPTLKFLMVDSRKASGTVTALPNADSFEALVVSIADLPSRWLDLSSLDVLAMSPNDLSVVERTNPQALSAVRRWVRAGGQLWVSPVGRDWESLGDVEEMLDLPATSGATVGDGPDGAETSDVPATGGWKPIRLGRRSGESSQSAFLYLPTGQTRTVSDPDTIERLENDPDWELVGNFTSSESGEPTKGSKLPADSGQWYLQQPLGLGYVRVFREAWDPVGFGISLQMLRGLTVFDPSETSGLTTPLTAAMDTTRNWESRHGLAPDSANSDFADWLVPGVGQAPVSEFRVLITLFVLIIGPLNYWVLQRAHRLHLLVLTVPLTALVLTTGLFAYALASDGFATRVRVRSFTTLDQRSGEAACWARLSYYAGLAPGRGLTLPSDVAIYPITPGWNEASGDASLVSARQLDWIGDQQRLSEGWLRSRTPTQYLTIRARKTTARIELESAPERMTATNALGTKIRYLAVADETGNLFEGAAMDDGATADLASTDSERVLRQLQRWLRENAPTVPAELTDEGTFILAQQRRQRRRFMRDRMGLSYGLERLGSNLQSAAMEGLVGADSAPSLNLAPRSYVAITENGPEVEIGIAGAREEASFHLLVGHW